ncbi:Aminopeptidase naaladl1 [Parelaphostrongylus tenuis]|uniref:Aminopeptidase naaladl1 n=1 Tax=Parelaphostrongylus tenuis TaxID=148309 RepID=A0AAD5R5T4_PARTN|nr:Aminopeptidase naaladl1 [Parelaphostrongylus tenuis]
MPSVASQLSSVDNFYAKQQLLDEYVASTKARDSLRTSQPSLIKSKRVFSRRQRWLPMAFGASLLGILATAGILLALACILTRLKSCKSPSISTAIRLRENPSELDRISKELALQFDSERIKQNIRWMAKTSHISGTEENSVLIRRIANEYRKLGFKVDTYNYSVLLNYPDFENANTVMVERNDGVWWRLSHGRGLPRGPQRAVNEVISSSINVAYQTTLPSKEICLLLFTFSVEREEEK